MDEGIAAPEPREDDVHEISWTALHRTVAEEAGVDVADAERAVRQVLAVTSRRPDRHLGAPLEEGTADEVATMALLFLAHSRPAPPV